MAKVAPSDPHNSLCPALEVTEFKLKQPFKYKPSFTEFSQEYLKARRRVGEHFAELKDGRKICYFRDGADGDIPVVCLHGGAESKWYFMQKEPIPGIQLISVDRYGYGRTDTIPKNKIQDFDWDDVIADMKEFLDVMKLDQVIWWGFSIGSSWAQNLAAALPDRTRGIIICGTMSDTRNKLMTKQERGKVGAPPGILNPKNGCCGCILRSAFLGIPDKSAKHNFHDAFEPDFKDKKAQKRFGKMLEDDFWISSKIDGILGNGRGEALMGDAIRTLCSPWKHGPQDIKCPIYIFQADHDEDMGSSSPTSPEFIKRVAQNCIALEWLEGAGHSFTVGPDDECRSHVLKAVEKMPMPPRT